MRAGRNLSSGTTQIQFTREDPGRCCMKACVLSSPMPVRCFRFALVLVDVLRDGVLVRELVAARFARRGKVVHQRYLQRAAVDRAGRNREFLPAVLAGRRHELALPVEHEVNVAVAVAAAVLVPELEWLEAGRGRAELAALDDGVRHRELQKALCGGLRLELVDATLGDVPHAELGRAELFALGLRRVRAE